MTERYDDFDLRIELLGPFDEDGPSYLITQAVYINGENLAPDNPIDLEDLAKSYQINGEHFIVTCGCGVAGCAGIEDGIRVTHSGSSIIWEVPTPLSYRDMSEEAVDDALHGKRNYRQFTFQSGAYLGALQKGLRQARALLFGERQPVVCSPHGMTPEHLLALDPLVFSKRGAPLGCTVIGQKVSLSELSNININGISYRISELPLPADIKALNDWSEWEPKDVGDGYIYGENAAPEWLVRRRKKQLAKHLASILVRGGTVEYTTAHYKDVEGTRWKRMLVLDGQARHVDSRQ